MKIEQRSYLEFHPREIDRERLCFEQLARELHRERREATVPSLLELFGGIGLLADVLQQEGFKIGEHWTWDLDPRCAELLQSQLPGAVVRVGDSFEVLPWRVFLLSADFNTFTVHKMFTQTKYFNIVDRMFKTGSEWIQLTDAAISKLHLNYRTYEEELGCSITKMSDYVTGLSRFLFEGYGYRLHFWTNHTNATYLLYRRQP